MALVIVSSKMKSCSIQQHPSLKSDGDSDIPDHLVSSSEAPVTDESGTTTLTSRIENQAIRIIADGQGVQNHRCLGVGGPKAAHAMPVHHLSRSKIKIESAFRREGIVGHQSDHDSDVEDEVDELNYDIKHEENINGELHGDGKREVNSASCQHDLLLPCEMAHCDLTEGDAFSDDDTIDYEWDASAYGVSQDPPESSTLTEHWEDQEKNPGHSGGEAKTKEVYTTQKIHPTVTLPQVVDQASFDDGDSISRSGCQLLEPSIAVSKEFGNGDFKYDKENKRPSRGKQLPDRSTCNNTAHERSQLRRHTARQASGKLKLPSKYEHCVKISFENGTLYTCRQCNYETNERTTLMNHLYNNRCQQRNIKKALHALSSKKKGQKRLYSCSNCEYKTKKQAEMKKHLDGNEWGKLECEPTFFTEKAYRCKVCGKMHASVLRLQNHMQSQHPKHGSVSQEENIECVPRHGQDYICTYCTFTTSGKQTIEQHMNSHSGISTRPYLCDLCGQVFVNQSALRNHHYSQHQKHNAKTCEICGKECKNEHALKRHRAWHNKGHNCTLCSYTSASSTHLQTHVRRVHLGEKQKRTHPCSLCRYAARNTRTLKMHLKTHGIGTEEQVSCDQCSAKLSSQSSLYRHKRQHGKILKYSCDICGKSFVQKCTLNRHLDMHKGINRYKCEVCDMAFSQSFPLTQHLKRNHAEHFAHMVATGKYKGQKSMRDRIRE